MKSNRGSQMVGLIVLITAAPVALIFGLVAAFFILQEIINGWIPSRWVSSSTVDWIFGSGTQGGARNYLGFMISAVPASMFGKAAGWGFAKMTAGTTPSSTIETLAS